MRIPHLTAILLLSACTVSVPPAAHAAQGYDNCAHFIDSVPAILDKQGVWCMNKDLSTAQTSGNAIEITTNNITLDCNDFGLGGIAGVDSVSSANGIYASARQNVTVRHCNVHGFNYGIELEGSGHLVEDNLLDGNMTNGISVHGGSTNNLVRRNRVFNTGGYQSDNTVEGISATGDIVDNIVDGVSADTASSTAIGIAEFGTGTRVSGNRIGGLKLNGGGMAYGIKAYLGDQAIVGNRIAAMDAATTGAGVHIMDGVETLCADNIVTNFATAYVNCTFVDGTYNASN